MGQIYNNVLNQFRGWTYQIVKLQCKISSRLSDGDKWTHAIWRCQPETRDFQILIESVSPARFPSIKRFTSTDGRTSSDEGNISLAAILHKTARENELLLQADWIAYDTLIIIR